MSHLLSRRATFGVAVFVGLALALAAAISARAQEPPDPTRGPPVPPNLQLRPMLRFEWLGHASFLIAAADGTSLLIDPYDDRIGLELPEVPTLRGVDHVLISHQHFAHDRPGSLMEGLDDVPIHRGAIGVPRSRFAPMAELTSGPFTVRSIKTAHDAEGGARLGDNALFVIEVFGLRIVHAGALGHTLDRAQVAQIGPVDVLMVPVGGRFTLDASGARTVAEQLEARIVVPMAYKIDPDANRPILPIAPVDPFIRLCPAETVRRLPGRTFSLLPARMPREREVRVLSFVP